MYYLEQMTSDVGSYELKSLSKLLDAFAHQIIPLYIFHLNQELYIPLISEFSSVFLVRLMG